MTIPLDASGLNFQAGLGSSPGLGGAANLLYSAKQLKTHFEPGSGQKNLSRLQDLYPRPSSKVRGRAWCRPGRVELKMLRYMCDALCASFLFPHATFKLRNSNGTKRFPRMARPSLTLAPLASCPG
jgi:hypothetical protein